MATKLCRDDMKRLRDAFRAGEYAASHLSKGDPFTGAWGAAAAVGITHGMEGSAFTEAYLATLESRFPQIVTDRNGRLTVGPIDA